MKVLVQGTLKELSQLWVWDVLHKLVHVDYYKRGMVSGSEVFTVTGKGLREAPLIKEST